MASTLTAYLLWLFGGLFGVHHLYLRRDAQAFLWCSTLGVFGLGWLRDVWYIPIYVAEVNDDPLYRSLLATKMQQEGHPRLFHSYKLSRFFAQCITGAFYYVLFGQAFYVLCTDEEHGLPAFGVALPDVVPDLAASVGMSAGIWIAGSTFRYLRCDPRAVLSGCLLGRFLGGVLGQLALGILFSYWHCSWVRTPQRPWTVLQRLITLSAGGIVYLGCWALIVFFLNFTILGDDGVEREVRVRDAVFHLCHSPVWRAAWSGLRTVHAEHGWRGIWNLLDLTGEAHAREIMGLPRGATQKEIKAAYRRLAREWHPDLNPDPHAKRKMEELNAAHALLTRSDKERSEADN